jgi:hypothetical protein
MADNRLAVALAFLNSRQLGGIADALVSPDTALRWLRGDGFQGVDESLMELVPDMREMVGAEVPNSEDVQTTRGVRDALLEWLDGKPLDPRSVEGLRFGADPAAGVPGLAPVRTGLLALAAHAYLVLAELHIAGKSQRLRRCEADDCRWVFYDRSRNQSKVWCDMSGCGSRAKARAYRERQAAKSSGA